MCSYSGFCSLAVSRLGFFFFSVLIVYCLYSSFQFLIKVHFLSKKLFLCKILVLVFFFPTFWRISFHVSYFGFNALIIVIMHNFKAI